MRVRAQSQFTSASNPGSVNIENVHHTLLTLRKYMLTLRKYMLSKMV